MTTTIPEQTALPTGTWSADAVHSRVEFAIDYMTGTFRGSFAPFEATLEVGGAKGARLEGAARAGDVHVQDENLSAHLQSPDFFDAERAPELRFRSTRIARAGGRLTVAGELTIRGETRDVRLEGTVSDPLTDPYGHERIGLMLEGKVDRTDFGIDWNAPLSTGDPALSTDVALTAELYLVKV